MSALDNLARVFAYQSRHSLASVCSKRTEVTLVMERVLYTLDSHPLL
jgi:hypothetical protein